MQFERCNIFSFGMVLLHCMTLMDPLKYFYVQYSVDIPAMRKAIRQRLNGMYSVEAVSLLEGCIHEDPDSRFNFEEIVSAYHSRFDENASLVLTTHSSSMSKAETEVVDRKSTNSRISLRRKAF